MNPFDKIRYIEIETHSSCTRNCSWCLFGAYPNFRPKNQSFLEDKYIDKVFIDLRENGFRGIIGLFSINEPLMDSRIVNGSLFERCKRILGNHALTTITTNGDLLSSELIMRLFKCGLDFIKISCYETDRYERLSLKYMNDSRITVLDQTRYNFGKYESNRGGSLVAPHPAIKMESCFFPQYRLAIGWDGEVRVCYHDVLQRIKIGNIKTSLLSSILSSSQYIQLIQEIQYSRQSVFPCSICNVCGNEKKFLASNEMIIKQLQETNIFNE